MNIKKLKKEGFEGFYRPGECGCRFEDNIPCDNFENDSNCDCIPGYIITKDQYDDEQKELFSDCEWIVGGNKQ